jgi:ectoine hydroxylase-related dioxygenase (phytanoyl-CoA dioxygenase family)
MLTASQLQQFHRDGFLLGRQILDANQVGILQEEMERVICDRGNKGVRQPVSIANLTGRAEEPVWQIVNIWQASEPFSELVHNPTIAEDIAQMLHAEELRLWHDQIQYKPAGVGGVNMWHQDWPYWGILSAPHQVTAWVALDDVDEENGCMSMVPGTHLWGNTIEFLHTLGQDFSAMPAEYQGKPVTIRTSPVKAGHVHYHHALTWHGSNRNRSGRKRRAIALHMMSNQTRYVAAGRHIMKQFVAVADGDVLAGDAFPVVWSAKVAEPSRL